MPNCSDNLHSIKAIKRHSILCHPKKAIMKTMMHHVCGSKSKNSICVLSFKTAAQLRKHRSLKDHVEFGRGRSVISQLHKSGLEPVKASETDWKTKNQEKNKDTRKKKKRSNPKTQRERKMAEKNKRSKPKPQ